MKYYFFKHRDIASMLAGLAAAALPAISLAQTAGVQTLQNPLGGITSVCKLVVALVDAATVIGIPVAILFVVWAGFKFILARGNAGALGEARTNFLNVVIGIGIFVGASLIASVIINTLQQLGVQGINSC